MEQFTEQLVMLVLGAILFCVSRRVYRIIYHSLSNTLGRREAWAGASAPGGKLTRRHLSEYMENEQRE